MAKKEVILIIFLVVLSLPLLKADSIGDSSSVHLSVSGGVSCSDDGYYWSDTTDPLHPKLNATTGASGNCYNPLGTSVKTCCPSGNECQNTGTSGDSGPIWKCFYTGIFYCSDIKDETRCNNATDRIIKDTAKVLNVQCGADESETWLEPGHGGCVNITSCSCEWNSTTSSCEGSYTKSRECQDHSTSPNIELCSGVINVEDKCNESGVMILHVTARSNIASPSINCRDGTKVISCDEIVKLDFFNKNNFLISVIAIILIYFAYAWAYENKLGKTKVFNRT